MHFKAPYDKRNDADYKMMTKRIAAALSLICENSSLLATEKSLSDLAGCSRGTLRNRIYPIIQLKEIKEQRKKNQVDVVHTFSVSLNSSSDKSQAETIKLLRDQIALCNTENSILINKYFTIEAELKAALRSIELLVLR